jgi:muramidase (phage lysozyme)
MKCPLSQRVSGYGGLTMANTRQRRLFHGRLHSRFPLIGVKCPFRADLSQLAGALQMLLKRWDDIRADPPLECEAGGFFFDPWRQNLGGG